MNIAFFRCADDPRKLNKNLLPVTAKNCTVYGINSTESPNIKLKYDVNIMNCNYFFIPDFNRYYTFETNLLPDGAIELVGACDFRLSYKNDIMASKGLIRRSNRGSKFLADNLADRTVNTSWQVRNLGSCFTPEVTYVLVKGN